MRLNITAFAIAHTVTAAILYVICSILVAFFPDAAARLAGSAFHADLSGIMRPINMSGFVVGLLVVSIGWGLLSLVVARVYNSLTKNGASIQTRETA